MIVGPVALETCGEAALMVGEYVKQNYLPHGKERRRERITSFHEIPFKTIPAVT
jgi:hypothetical protein